MTTDVATLTYKVDSRDMAKAVDALDDMADAADRAENAVEDLGNTSQKAGKKADKLGKGAGKGGKGVKLMGRNAGQAGIQVQQLVGQIQAGTNASVALSQQAADLGFVLGVPLLGVAVSLAAGLGGALVASLMDTTNWTKRLKEHVEELAEEYGDLTKAQAEWLAVGLAEELENANTQLDKTVQKMYNLQNLIGRKDDFLEAKSNVDSLRQIIAGLTEDLERLNSIIAGNGDPSAVADRMFPSQEIARRRRLSLQSEIDALVAYETKAEKERAEAQAKGHAKFARQGRDVGLMAREQEAADAQTHLTLMASYYREYSESRVASDIWAAEQAEIAEEKKQNNIQTIRSSFDSLFRDMMDSQNKDIFEIGKLGAASKAAVDAYTAINATLAQGGAFAVPAATAIGAAAFANVASIMSTQFGSQGGRSAAAAVPPPSITNSTQSTQATINITGGVGFGLDELQTALNDNDVILFNKDSAQARI